MDVSITSKYHKKIRSFLVFFYVTFIFSCTNGSDTTLSTKVNYHNTTALSVSFESTLSIDELNLFLRGTNDIPILGDFVVDGNELLFKPVIPFTNGNTYEIYHKKKNIGVFTIDALIDSEQPTITAIYPSMDTIPENLLKMYLVFSKPMQEVQNALNFIKVYNVTDDELTTIFLELENELWSSDHTELTLWLDPGRIKTDLIPNRTKGLPIEAGKHYTVSISNKWKDANNNQLDTTYVKHLYVGPRDSSKILVDSWNIRTPKQGTLDTLIVETIETLDAMLALETVRIMSLQDTIVDGTFELGHQEQQLLFIPKKPWKLGNYKFTIESVLEDLAGNNLNHLFDKDLLFDTDTTYKKQHTVDFIID